MEQLRDIKGLAEISTNAYALLGVVFVLCVLLSAWYVWYRFKRTKKKKSPKEEALASLQTMDFHDAKEAAYHFTHYGRMVLREDSLHVKHFEAIVHELEMYKFKKEVPSLDASLQERMQAFIQELSPYV